MSQQDSVNSALLAEVFNVLDHIERHLNKLGTPCMDELIDLIVELRRKLISAGSDTGIYTAAHLRAVLDTVMDGIVIIDACGTIETFNPAAERIFGYTVSEVIGKNINILMPLPHRGEHNEYLARYLRTGKAKVIGIGRKVIGERKDGSMFPMSLALSEVRLGDRHTFTGIVRDLSKVETSQSTVLSCPIGA